MAMLPRETIATAQIPGGETLTLVSHGRDFIIMLGRDELMGTRMQYSEEQLAVLTLAELEAAKPRVLIGGFGMGFTYRAALSHLPEGGQVVVAELVPEILEWARGPLSHLSAASLDDPRGEVILCNVEALIDDANDGTSASHDDGTSASHDEPKAKKSKTEMQLPERPIANKLSDAPSLAKRRNDKEEPMSEEQQRAMLEPSLEPMS